MLEDTNNQFVQRDVTSDSTDRRGPRDRARRYTRRNRRRSMGAARLARGCRADSPVIRSKLAREIQRRQEGKERLIKERRRAHTYTHWQGPPKSPWKMAGRLCRSPFFLLHRGFPLCHPRPLSLFFPFSRLSVRSFYTPAHESSSLIVRTIYEVCTPRYRTVFFFFFFFFLFERARRAELLEREATGHAPTHDHTHTPWSDNVVLRLIYGLIVNRP